MRLANKIEELKTEAKAADGYRFDVRPHRNDPEKWIHVFKTDYLTREWIKQLLKEIWELNKEDAYREVEVNVDERTGRSPLSFPIGMRVKKETAGYKGENAV
jgi:uncharacterized coiled-coil DUF342 family protein